MPDKNYSARFERTVSVDAGTYVFSLVHDDGARLLIDGVVVYDGFARSSGDEGKSVAVPLTAGDHEVEVEYFQQYYGAKLSVEWELLPPQECAADAWSVSYFAGTALQGSPIARDCLTDLDWQLATGEAPVAGVAAKNYSARFKQTIDVPAGIYEFSLSHDDGARLLVDGVVAYDAFVPSSGNDVNTVAVALTGGEHEIEVEYFQQFYGAKLSLDYEAVSLSDTTAPPIPVAVSATATGEGIDITWDPVVADDLAGYNIYRGADAGVAPDSATKVNDAILTATSFTDPTALAGTEYFYVVTSVDHTGNESNASSAASAELDGTAPPAPASANAFAGETSIALLWGSVSADDLEGYNVYRGTAAGVSVSPGNKLNSIPTTSTSLIDADVVAGVTYYYVVTAVDSSGNESAPSNEVSGALPNDDEPPAAPQNVTAVAADAEVVLSWDAVDAGDLAGYRVYRSLETGAYTGAVAVTGEELLDSPTFTDTNVDNNTTYFYQVVAVDGSGNESDPSNEVIATPRVPNTTDISVDFTATDAAPEDGFVADWGQPYGARTSPGQGSGLTYGWVDADGHELSLVGNGRDRARPAVDSNLNTIIHMQYGDVDGGNGTNGVKTPGAWEIAVPGGLYEVTVAVGDQMGADSYDSEHTVNVEGSVAINEFQGTAAQEFETYTATVGVWDGKLTLDALGGVNTKPAYVEIRGIEFDRPHVDTVNPLNRALDADTTGGVAATFARVHSGGGVNDQTMPGNVKVFNVATGAEVPGSVNTSGGNDTINFDPDGEFAPNTTYRFEVSSEVEDLFGNPFVPFTSIFRTGDGVIVGGEEFTPLTNIAFEKVQIDLPEVDKYWASFAFGPDERLYGTTIGQGLFRFDVDEQTGELSNMTDLGYQGYAMIGILFDESSTASDLKVWVTKTSANVGNEQNQFISAISLLTGDELQNEKQVFTGLPRSQSDHLTNSMVYGPEGDIYVLQGSNQAAGDLDNSWGQRGEQLLTAALLNFDPDHARIQASLNDAQGDNPLLVQTAPSGNTGEDVRNGFNAASPYNPFAAGAPLEIYATGIRNAYDLTYHSNGHIYVATNGTAGGGNSPGVNYNAANDTWTRVAAPGIPGFSSVNGQDLTQACRAREQWDPTFVPRSVPAISNHPTQRDHLYDVVKGGYYGHPNPTRCEFVLHEGNDPANPPQWAGQGGSKYASGVLPESHYDGVAYDFEYNKSPNGTIEYTSKTFGGALEGRIIVVRFSNNNDLIFLQADAVTGKILGGQTEVGITGVPNSTIAGVGGFNDPLEVVEDVRNGNLYVNQYDRAGSNQALYLLRVPASQRAAKVTADRDELVYSAVTSNGALVDSTAAHRTDVEELTITNESSEPQSLTLDIAGAHAAEFSIDGTVPASLASGASVTLSVRFTPGTTAGQRQAELNIAGGDSNVVVPLYGLAMAGIQGGNEPTFAEVMGTLGYGVDVGWTNLAGGMSPAAKGDEVLEPLFVKAGTAPVTWTPLAHYAPGDLVSFGWYTGEGTQSERSVLGTMDGRVNVGGYQSLLPPYGEGSTPTFDPAGETFGFYYYSPFFTRYGFTEDRLNSPASEAHRARIYPAKNRNGVTIPNAYLIAFEDAANGDYQDYVFLVSGIKPVTDTGSGGSAIKVDFTTATGDLAPGYLRDYGQAFGPKTRADQGSGLVYGWKGQTTEDDLDISVGGTTPGNGRDRGTAQADMRLDSIMHMQPSGLPNFNGTPLDAYWELQVPNGEYEITVGVGDAQPGNDPENHVINAEGETIISGFVPSGANGQNSRHTIASGTVEVTDGFLTIDPVGGTNTKIAFVDVVPVGDTGSDPSDGAQVKINFQPATAPVPDGWTAEIGEAFSTERGFGWMDEATDEPVARIAATRYRAGALSGIAYPSDERLKTYAFLDNSTQPDYTSGYWEYLVPNGTYQVALSVGDANYIDSTHSVTVEGQPVINGFVPTEQTPFQTGIRTVTVTDGRLTVANSGDNSKINWISIKGDGLDGGPTEEAQVKVNFQPAAAPVPDGWTAETGLAFTSDRGFGWFNAANDQAVERSIATRYRTAPLSGIAYPADPTLQTYAFLDNVTQPAYTDGYWEYALPNGTYEVELSVGDANYLDSVHQVYVEGDVVIDGFVPTAGEPFQTGSATVEVTDGRLTLSTDYSAVVDNLIEGNTKVNWITISGEGLEPSVPTTTAHVTFQPAAAPVPQGWTADTGAAYSAAAGQGWLVSGQPADRSAQTRLRAAPAGDPLRQGLILMQNVTTTGSTITGGSVGHWEYDLANGVYTVTASVGDGEYDDSIHGLEAEGVALVTGFEPTAATPFATGTAQVVVTDGKLTLVPTGVNTKMNWITITGQALADPSIVVEVNNEPVNDTYEGGVAVVAATAVPASGSTVESFTYSINGGEEIDVDGDFELSTPGEYEVVFSVTDSEDRTAQRTVDFTVLNIGGTVELTSAQAPRQPNGEPLAGMRDDLLVMHRMNGGTTNGSGTLLYRSYDSATVEVANTGTRDLRITELSISGPQAGQFQLVDPPALPLFIEPGDSVDLTAQFIGSGGAKGMRTATLNIASSNVGAATTQIDLHAGYMSGPEGGSELTLGQVIDIFDSQTFVGTDGSNLPYGSENHGSALNGEEVRSALWKRLDASKPVQAVQLAAFHGQGGSETLRIANSSVSMAGLDAQSLFPKTGGGNPVTLSLNPTGNFDIAISGQTTNRTDYMAVKTWPFKDAAGDIVPGSWWVGHDYIASLNQCGVGPTNCDFQDNIYLVTNVVPVTTDASAPAAPAAPVGVADEAGVDLTWAASAESDLMGYRVERASAAAGPWAVVSGSGIVTGTSFRDTAVGAAAQTHYRIVAVDATGNATPGPGTAVDTSMIEAAPIRINAGGPQVTAGGVTWLEDQFFVGGKSFSNTSIANIGGTTSDVLFLTERSAVNNNTPFSYAIPVSGNGSYQVILHYAEIYHNATGGGTGGSRVFSVNFEGGPVEIVNLNLNMLVGPMNAYSTTNTVNVTDGVLNISFTSTVDQPKVSAIEVVKN
ncbi:malectin domain-containing carbohydrate-binding protein [Demequina globuliformis]|uniref:malectin domain-containing carbohydrate-binding protein n=1 Tax=Demequina globuliformis TaxID=676202 RepID=UPI001EED92DF